MEIVMSCACSFWFTSLLATVLFLNGGVIHAATVEHHGEMVDTESGHLECLTCHDGALAHSIEACTENCGIFVHPVDRKYPPKGKEREYAPAGQLSWQGIRLHKNRISCISCHDLENAEEHHLVQAQDLCSTCHILK